MKRNTTPTLPVVIRMPFDEVQALEFMFKKDPYDFAAELLHIKFEEREKIPLKESTDESFTVNLKFEAEDTMKLPAGTVYMDTRIVLTDGIIPETKIVRIDDIQETLFGEVYRSD